MQGTDAEKPRLWIGDLIGRKVAPHCSICGAIEPRCATDAAAVVCSACTCNMAELRVKLGGGVRRVGKPCKDCGGEAQPRKQFCERCAKKRQRESKRKAWNQRKKTGEQR